MTFLYFFVFLITIICCNILHCNAATVESIKMIKKFMETPSLKNDENKTAEVQTLWENVLLPKQTSSKTEELNKIANTNVNSAIRKSKILGSLAFLAGLSVGDLTGASSANTYAKRAPVSLNFEASRVSPQIGSIYGLYPYVSHPYIFASPLGFYSVLSPLGLQSISGFQNDFQALTQAQALNLLGTKKPTDLSNNDEYIEEAKRVETVKSSNTIEKEIVESDQSPIENDRNVEEKMLKTGTPCSEQKEHRRKQDNLLRDDSEERDRVEDVNTARQNVFNATNRNTTSGNRTTIPSTTMNSAINSTQNNETTIPPFYGYYGGYPQNIDNVDFTTEASDYKYHNYKSINYNLPYDKPANFYSDERYNYYVNPSLDSSVPNEFSREQIPEYFPYDFNRYLYTSYNTPPLANSGFRPVV